MKKYVDFEAPSSICEGLCDLEVKLNSLISLCKITVCNYNTIDIEIFGNYIYSRYILKYIKYDDKFVAIINYETDVEGASKYYSKYLNHTNDFFKSDDYTPGELYLYFCDLYDARFERTSYS